MLPTDRRSGQALVCVLAHTHTHIIIYIYPVVCAFLQMAPVAVPADDGPQHIKGSVVIPVQAAPKPKVLPGPIPSGHIPKPVILPDYIA